MKVRNDEVGNHTNPDAITGAPASHPGATAVGSASGAATGAAIGAIGGPAGAVIGAIAGGVIGGWTGHSIGEWNDPSDAVYWKDEYKNRSYYDRSADYDRDVTPALQYGSSLGSSLESDSAVGTGLASETDKGAIGEGKPLKSDFESLEDTAMREWDKVKGQSKYTYEQARSAISDAYNRKVSQHQDKMQASDRS